MLVLARRENEAVVIGGGIRIRVIEVKGGQVRLGIDAPREVPVHREEIARRIEAAAIAGKFAKEVVVILCWDRAFNMGHTTSFGVTAEDKLLAADMADEASEAAGFITSQKRVYEDFRLDTTRLKEENDQLRQRVAQLEAAKAG